MGISENEAVTVCDVHENCFNSEEEPNQPKVAVIIFMN